MSSAARERRRAVRCDTTPSIATPDSARGVTSEPLEADRPAPGVDDRGRRSGDAVGCRIGIRRDSPLRPSQWPGRLGARAAGGRDRAPRPRTVPAMNLISEAGKPFSLRSWRGKWVILAPSMTLCHEVCPMTTGVLEEVEHRLRQVGLSKRRRRRDRDRRPVARLARATARIPAARRHRLHPADRDQGGDPPSVELLRRRLPPRPAGQPPGHRLAHQQARDVRRAAHRRAVLPRPRRPGANRRQRHAADHRAAGSGARPTAQRSGPAQPRASAVRVDLDRRLRRPLLPDGPQHPRQRRAQDGDADASGGACRARRVTGLAGLDPRPGWEAPRFRLAAAGPAYARCGATPS